MTKKSECMRSPGQTQHNMLDCFSRVILLHHLTCVRSEKFIHHEREQIEVKKNITQGRCPG